MRGRTLRLLVLVLALVTANCGGPDLDLGLQAYNQGDYSGALKHIRPFSRAGAFRRPVQPREYVR